MPCPFSSLHADVTAHCPFLRSVLNRKSDANEVNVQPTGLCERASEHSQPEGYSFLNEPVRFAQAYAMVHGPGGALPHDEFDSKFHGADFALDSYYPTSMQAEADQTVSPCALGGASLPPRRRVLGPASISLAAGFPERVSNMLPAHVNFPSCSGNIQYVHMKTLVLTSLTAVLRIFSTTINMHGYGIESFFIEENVMILQLKCQFSGGAYMLGLDMCVNWKNVKICFKVPGYVRASSWQGKCQLIQQ